MHRSQNLLGPALVDLAMFVLPLFVLAVTSASGQSAADVQCEIRVREHGQSVIIGASIAAKEPVTGTFDLSARQVGSRNTSSVKQSGNFSATPAEPTAIGTIALSGPGGVDVHLVLRGGDQSSECTRQITPPSQGPISQ